MIDPHEFDRFTKSYLVALIQLTEAEEEFHDMDDCSQELLEAVQQDCTDFQTANKDLLDLAYNHPTITYNEDQAGTDFYLTRCGHGSGFWDRGLDEIGTKLTDASKVYGDVYSYVGDDSQIY